MSSMTGITADLERFYGWVAETVAGIPSGEISQRAHAKSRVAMEGTLTALVASSNALHAAARDCHREAEFYHQEAAAICSMSRAEHVSWEVLHRRMLEYHSSIVKLPRKR